MEVKDIIEIIMTILAGVLTCVPLVVKLVEYVKKAWNEKDWGRLVGLVSDMMSDAEKMFGTGEERKQWVLENIEFLAEQEGIRCEIDIAAIDRMIDTLCAMSKNVNPPVVKEIHEEA